MTVLRVLLVVTLVISGTATWAQQAPSSPPQHQHAEPKLIDGSAHPELVPDSVAYRLFLVSVSRGQRPTEAEQKHQRAQLMQTGLDDIDQQMFLSVLSDFRVKYDALVAEYNDSAKAALAHNEAANVQVLLNKLDALVQSTRAAINVRLTSEGAAQLHSHVLSEKKNMKVME
jgi:hypothetical protein